MFAVNNAQSGLAQSLTTTTPDVSLDSGDTNNHCALLQSVAPSIGDYFVLPETVDASRNLLAVMPMNVDEQGGIVVDYCRAVTRAQTRAETTQNQINTSDYLSQAVDQSSQIVDNIQSFDSPRVRRRRKRGPNNLLQQTAPDAAIDLALNNHWPTDYIVQQQQSDTVLSHVKSWLGAGKRPEWADVPSDPAVKTYYQLFDSLIIDNDVMYKIFYDDRGRVQYHQLLIPESMRASFLELCHNDALCHARTMSKNQAAVQRRGYWPGWKISVKVFVKNCRRCAEYHRGLRRNRDVFILLGVLSVLQVNVCLLI